MTSRFEPCPLAVRGRVGGASSTTCRTEYGSESRRGSIELLGDARDEALMQLVSVAKHRFGTKRVTLLGRGVHKSDWQNWRPTKVWKSLKSASAEKRTSEKAHQSVLPRPDSPSELGCPELREACAGIRRPIIQVERWSCGESSTSALEVPMMKL